MLQSILCFDPFVSLCFIPILISMEPQNPPLKIARFADFGIELTNLGGNSWNMESNMLSGTGGDGSHSPPIGLGLQLGRGSSSHRQTGFTKSCGFTVFQLQELQLQSLIYKYMEAGLPVPNNLLPIWKSVVGSLHSLHGNPYQLYPSFMGCGSLHLEYKNGVDPEPGRCRRTDGKKWRCSKEAVQDHKYCERHMHRGRRRSRKLVEASNQQATSSTVRISHGNNANTNLSISLQLDSSSTTSSNGSSTLNSSFIGFSPKRVLRGSSNPKPESSLQIQEF